MYVRITGLAHNMCRNKCSIHNYAGIVAPTSQPVKSTAPVTTWSKSLVGVLRPMSYLLLQPQGCRNHRSSSQVGRIHRSTSEVCQKDNQAHNTPSERCQIHRSSQKAVGSTGPGSVRGISIFRPGDGCRNHRSTCPRSDDGCRNHRSSCDDEECGTTPVILTHF